MNRTRISLTAALLSLCLLLSGCMMPPAEGTVTSFSLEDIPAWSGEPYVAVDGNQPDFPEEDMTSVSFETYSELDTLGRCGVAYANEGQIKRVAASTYIITPRNVDFMGDLLDELENNGVYF